MADQRSCKVREVSLTCGSVGIERWSVHGLVLPSWTAVEVCVFVTATPGPGLSTGDETIDGRFNWIAAE
jgi:hypothetical protein